MDQFLTREIAAKQISNANKLKERFAQRLIDKEIEPRAFMRITGRVNNYIKERLPYLL